VVVYDSKLRLGSADGGISSAQMAPTMDSGSLGYSSKTKFC
jgi:hypothetical protein